MKAQLDQLSVSIYEQNVAVGWWDNPDRDIFQTLQLVVTEVSEATEGERSNLMDTKLKHRKMGEVELADAVIRLLDLAGRYGWKISHDEVSSDVMVMRTTAGAHLFISDSICAIGVSLLDKASLTEVQYFYSLAVNSIFWLGKKLGYDVMGALEEKVQFNRTREDHKRSERAKENGKKF